MYVRMHARTYVPVHVNTYVYLGGGATCASTFTETLIGCMLLHVNMLQMLNADGTGDVVNLFAVLYESV